jgi:hypothetical protein
MPPKPDAELCFSIYRLIMPEARARCVRVHAGAPAHRRTSLTTLLVVPTLVFPARAAPARLTRRLAPRRAQLDKERQVYKLKEQALAEVLALSLGLSKGTKHHEKLIAWRKQHGGNFAANVVEARARVPRQRARGAPGRRGTRSLDADEL